MIEDFNKLFCGLRYFTYLFFLSYLFSLVPGLHPQFSNLMIIVRKSEEYLDFGVLFWSKTSYTSKKLKPDHFVRESDFPVFI